VHWIRNRCSVNVECFSRIQRDFDTDFIQLSSTVRPPLLTLGRRYEWALYCYSYTVNHYSFTSRLLLNIAKQRCTCDNLSLTRRWFLFTAVTVVGWLRRYVAAGAWCCVQTAWGLRRRPRSVELAMDWNIRVAGVNLAGLSLVVGGLVSSRLGNSRL